MSGAELLRQMVERGFRVSRHGNCLDIHHIKPGVRLPPKVAALVEALHPEILALVPDGGCAMGPEGWRLLYSERLRELVVVVFDPAVCVPEHVQKYVVYTLDEAWRLEGTDDPLLRSVQMVKRVFPGSEVVEGPGNPGPQGKDDR